MTANTAGTGSPARKTQTAATQSISAGNWLGEYNWLTMSKHSFFALWLAFLNAIHLNVLVGGQLLFAGACFVLLAALKPALKTNLARLFVFGITLFTPATWAESSLRVYRDNIYPALLLYVLADTQITLQVLQKNLTVLHGQQQEHCQVVDLV